MIYPEHKAFAQAVVALAREHGMDALSVEFQFGHAMAYRGDGNSRGSDRVKMGWSSGRHGDQSRITLSAHSFENIDEAEASPAQAGKGGDTAGGDRE